MCLILALGSKVSGYPVPRPGPTPDAGLVQKCKRWMGIGAQVHNAPDTAPPTQQTVRDWQATGVPIEVTPGPGATCTFTLPGTPHIPSPSGPAGTLLCPEPSASPYSNKHADDFFARSSLLMEGRGCAPTHTRHPPLQTRTWIKGCVSQVLKCMARDGLGTRDRARDGIVVTRWTYIYGTPGPCPALSHMDTPKLKLRHTPPPSFRLPHAAI